MPIFAVTYRYTPEPDRQAELRPERHRWFEQLAADGRLLASGQLLDGDLGDGMLVLRAKDVAEANAILADDPYATAGLVVERPLSQWRATVGEWIN